MRAASSFVLLLFYSVSCLALSHVTNPGMGGQVPWSGQSTLSASTWLTERPAQPRGTTNLPPAWTTRAHSGPDVLRGGREGPGPATGVPPAMPVAGNIQHPQGHDQSLWNNPEPLPAVGNTLDDWGRQLNQGS